MTLTAVTVPTWGLAMEEGTLVHWYVKSGDRVSPGDALVDIETTKITNTLEAEHAGTICQIVGSKGETLPCGRLIAVLDDADASDEEIATFVTGRLAAIDGEPVTKRQPAEPKTLESGDWRLRYLATGDGDGIPALFIHGFGGDLSNWTLNQGVLAENRRAIAIDLPGHGGSSKMVGDGTIEFLATAVIAAITELGLDRIHLIGHSLGGAVAAAVALAVPDKVASLTLVCPVGLSERANEHYISGFLAAKRRRDLQDVLRELFHDESFVTASMAEDMLKAKRVDGALEALQRVATAAFDGPLQRVSLRRRLDNLRAPLLIIWGQDDKIIPAPQETDPLPGQLKLITDAGHMPHLEKSSEVNALISRHLESSD